MSMSIDVARIRIAREIQEAEQSLDTALINQANLLASLVQARRETGSSPSEGHDVLLRLHKSQQSLLESGAELARVHGRMLDIQEERGIIRECPPNEPMGLIDNSSRAA